MTPYDLMSHLGKAASSKNLSRLIGLLQMGADPNRFFTDKNPWNAMQEATSEGFIAGLEKLVEFGGDVNATGADNTTPLMVAALTGQVEAGRWLLRHGANAICQDAKDNTALSTALYYGKVDFASMMLQECPALDKISLETAASRSIVLRNLDVAQWLLLQGVSPDIKSTYGDCWLSLAQSTTFLNSEAITDLLLTAGAQVNMKNATGRTPLHEALLTRLESNFAKLLRSGADPDIPDNRGVTVRGILKDQGPKSFLEFLNAWEASAAAQRGILNPVAPDLRTL